MLTRLSLSFCFLLGGCNVLTSTTPDERPDVEGVVISLLPDKRAKIEATYKAGPYPDTFYVNPGAEVRVREINGSVRLGDKNDIRVGDHLRAWLTGIELRSLPPQYPARVVEVRRSTP